MLKPFRLLRPATIEEASRELTRLGDQAKVYAGGVELLLLMRHGMVEAEYLVDIKRIPEMDVLSWDGQHLRIGACVTHRTLEDHRLVAEHLPLLAEAERHVGNVRVRSQGTLGGNLCFADPHADPGTVLLVHEATVTLAGANGRRELPLADFFRGMYDVALEEGELLTGVSVPPLPAGWRGGYQRFEQFYRPTLNVAAAVRADGDRLADVRLAAGCVGPQATRLSDLEQRLRGLPLADALRLVGESAPYLEQRLEPIGDLLGSAAFKIHLTKVLIGRAITQTLPSPAAFAVTVGPGGLGWGNP
ncbi:MAG TPA: xanthine dehydrogenase family protein subunit M [Chloroflexota bacterium]|nr:xanthine dehydrogenase family protein subunit M [Chloroflexota bacterium]